MKLQTIYLDMDGPLANFHLEAVRAHLRSGKRYPKLHDGSPPIYLTAENLFRRWPKGTSLHKVCCDDLPLEMPNFWSEEMNGFWKPIEDDPLFWRNIEPMGYYKELWELCHDFAGEVRICTTPHRHHFSYSGKRLWLQNHKLCQDEPIFCREKWRLVHPNELLIDDHGGHITAWREECQLRYGVPGKSILYPAVWNEQHAHAFNPLSYIERLLNVFTNGD